MRYTSGSHRCNRSQPPVQLSLGGSRSARLDPPAEAPGLLLLLSSSSPFRGIPRILYGMNETLTNGQRQPKENLQRLRLLSHKVSPLSTVIPQLFHGHLRPTDPGNPPDCTDPTDSTLSRKRGCAPLSTPPASCGLASRAVAPFGRFSGSLRSHL